MNKHILIIVGSYEIGGTVVSLYSLLSKIPQTGIRVDLFCRLWHGDYKTKMPNCTVLKENVWLSHRMTEAGNLKKSINYILWIIRKLFGLIGIDMFRIYCKIGGSQIHSRNYDAIIGFDESMAPLISYMPAKKRINWIHCDYRRYAKGKDETQYYKKINTIVCVSEFVKNIFSELYPQFADRVVAIHNVINVEDINAKAQTVLNDVTFDTTSFTIVSCGRLDPVKQFSLIPYIAKEICNLTNHSFKWYIIGDGDDRTNIERQIKKSAVENNVMLLGKKLNPYPYIAKANLYVCTSKSESFPLVINEAKALCVPVLCNNFPSASESITSENEGRIASVDKFPVIIAEMMNNPTKYVFCAINNAHILKQISAII